MAHFDPAGALPVHRHRLDHGRRRAWNASIVAEHVEFGSRTHTTVGVGALIAQATGSGDYALLAATLSLLITVVLINRFFWLRLYRLAEERFRLE